LNLYEAYFPVVTTKFNRNLHSIEKWFSKGLLISRANKNKLSKAVLLVLHRKILTNLSYTETHTMLQ
jgi:hypothetical protein